MQVITKFQTVNKMISICFLWLDLKTHKSTFFLSKRRFVRWDMANSVSKTALVYRIFIHLFIYFCCRVFNSSWWNWPMMSCISSLMTRKRSRAGLEEVGSIPLPCPTQLVVSCARILRKSINSIPMLESEETRYGGCLEKREREEEEEN